MSENYCQCLPIKIPKPVQFYLLFMLLSFITAISTTGAAHGASVSSEVYTDTTKSRLSSPTLKGIYYKQEEIPLSVVLGPVANTEKAQLTSTKSQPLKIGFGRDIPHYYQGDVQPLLSWTSLDGEAQTATFSVTSPDAKAIRLALQVEHLPEGAEVRFFSLFMPEQVFGPFTRQDMTQNPSQQVLKNDKDPLRKTQSNKDQPTGDLEPFWSPVIEGDTIGVEIYVPSLEAQYELSLKIAQVSHLAYSVLSPDEKSLSDIGQSDSCNIDVACQVTNPANLKNAVAKIIFSEGGSSFLCTGSLLNDNDPGGVIPYFMTANHCLNTQAVASTVNSFWFFERAACGGANPTSVTQLTSGADLLSTGAPSDFTLLQLRDVLPTGVMLAGWTNQPLVLNEPIIGIHHPAGDLKKWSHGNAIGFAEFGGPVSETGTHAVVQWTQGTTEGGSSGSGIFDAQGQFRGNLHGGSASCTAPNAPDYYGRFDVTYAAVKRWLLDVPIALAGGVGTLGAVQSGQWKEYSVRVPAGQTGLRVELLGLSQDADLYVRRGSRPTGNIFDCRPFFTGVNPETCSIANSGDNIYYIGVWGYAPGNTTFTIKATPF